MISCFRNAEERSNKQVAQFKKQLIIRTFTTHLIQSHCNLIAAILIAVLYPSLYFTHLIFSPAACEEEKLVLFSPNTGRKAMSHWKLQALLGALLGSNRPRPPLLHLAGTCLTQTGQWPCEQWLISSKQDSKYSCETSGHNSVLLG